MYVYLTLFTKNNFMHSSCYKLRASFTLWDFLGFTGTLDLHNLVIEQRPIAQNCFWSTRISTSRLLAKTLDSFQRREFRQIIFQESGSWNYFSKILIHIMVKSCCTGMTWSDSSTWSSSDSSLVSFLATIMDSAKSRRLCNRFRDFFSSRASSKL